MSEEKKIIDYCADIATNGFVQGNQSWIDDKKNKFGGTSMGYFTEAKYKLLYNMVAERVGLSNNKSEQHVLSFGSMFEELVKRVAEYDTKSKTYGENIYVMHNDYIAYSPDGIAYLDTSLFNGPNAGRQICLQEFKCPFSRYPNGFVPEEYVAQQQMGLDVIKMCKYSLYLEAVFRRCTWKDLGSNNKYDHDLNIFNEDKPQLLMTNLPLAWGFIGFGMKKDFIHSDPKCNEILNKAKSLGDIGKLSVDEMKIFIGLYADKSVTPYYYNLLWNNFDQHTDWKDKIKSDVNVFKQQVADDHNIIVGMLPYKLFRRDYHWVKPINGFLDKYANTMAATANLISRIRAEPDKIKKQSMMDSFFDPYDCDDCNDIEDI
jgi:hypothetical protein